MQSIIRSGRIINKCYKGKDEVPTIIIKEQNGAKIPIPINSGQDLDVDFKMGQELRIRIEEIPHRVFDEPITQTPIVEPTPTPPCPKAALPDEMGKAEVCVDCEHLKEDGLEEICDLALKSSD